MHSEKQIESRLVKGVEKLGGTAEKFTSPARRNVPDRLVTMPKKWHVLTGFDDVRGAAQISFVECKKEGEKPTHAQRRDHIRRIRMGCKVFVVDSYQAVDLFLVGALPEERI